MPWNGWKSVEHHAMKCAKPSGGDPSDARHGRTEFQYTFSYEDEWNGTYYEHKELTVYAADDGGDWIVVTVISRYY